MNCADVSSLNQVILQNTRSALIDSDLTVGIPASTVLGANQLLSCFNRICANLQSFINSHDCKVSLRSNSTL